MGNVGGKSPAEIVFGRSPRVPIVAPYQQGEAVWYQATPRSDAIPARFVMTRGSNTSWIIRDDKLALTSNNQIAEARVPEEVTINSDAEDIADTGMDQHRQEIADPKSERPRRMRHQPDRLTYPKDFIK